MSANSWAWCCTPVIPAIQEVEIRRMKVPSQHKQKSSISNRKKLFIVVHTCHPSYSGKPTIESQSKMVWAKSKTLSPK
jgi:ribosomal protein L31